MQFNTIIISKFVNNNLKNSKMKNSNWIFLLSMITLVAESIFWFAGRDTLFLGSVYVALICTYFVIKELEKLNDTKSSKKSDKFAKNFGDWLKYESVCFPEHKDKSIEELLEIYKKSI